MEESKTSRLRPEGVPLPFRELQEYQQIAVTTILEALNEAVDDLKRDSGRHGVIDPARASRTYFLSGEPGSGKSSVYVSLRAFCENHEAWQRLCKRESEAARARRSEGESEAAGARCSEGESEATGARRSEAQRLLTDIRDKVTWLPPIDLEPCPDFVNFLAAVLVRIEKAVTGQRGGPRRDDTHREYRKPGLLDHVNKNQEVLNQLKRLQSQVALAWNGNLPARGAHIEPDSFAAEVVRAEKARMEINQQVYKALAELTSRSDGPRLFVLPVDDLYLRPALSLQFLRLLRMISVPQLFVLLMGDFDVLDELFYQNMLGQLVRLAGEQTFASSRYQREILPSRARQLSSHALRKLLPPAQRIRLEVPHESPAGFYPRRPGADEKRNLATLLGEVSLGDPWPGVATLKDLLLWKDDVLLEDDEKNGTYPENYPYVGMEVLDTTPRSLADLWFRLQEFTEPGAKEDSTRNETSLLSLVMEQAVEALGEQTFLTEEARRAFETTIDRRGQYMPPRLATKDLRLHTGCAKDRRLLESDVEYYLCWRPEWRMELAKKVEDDREGKDEASLARLPPRPRAWFVVLHDLLAAQRRLRGGSLVTRLITEQCGTFDAAGDEQRGEPPDGWFAYTRKDKKWIAWPMPRWKRLWYLDRFAFQWGSYLEENQSLESAVEATSQWITIISQLLGESEEILKDAGTPDAMWERIETHLGNRQPEGEPGEGSVQKDRNDEGKAGEDKVHEEWLSKMKKTWLCEIKRFRKPAASGSDSDTP